jgi:aminodeoxyfutalosine deaminase
LGAIRAGDRPTSVQLRTRHGIRAVDDTVLLAEIVERGIVLDVAPVSNLRERWTRSPQDP